ncbi:MAG: agmatinase [Phycisphaerales bacterium]|nr:MAG: agmatinase [Phycisphaerales bacterium]
MSTIPNNFLGLEPEFSAYADARFAILPVPYDCASSFQAGSRNGPGAIISASQHVELFDEEVGTESHSVGIATLDPVEPNRAGPAAMHENLFEIASRIVRDGKFLFALGGDHSITSALVRAVMAKNDALSVLQIDAHCDLRESFEGTPYSHASVMRRVFDLGASIVPVGVRTLDADEHAFLQHTTIQPITAHSCHYDNDWTDRAINALGDTVYVTIDIDGFDPAYAPGTGTPEPGGLDWYQVTGLLRRVAREKKVVSADIVEVMPIPGQVVTEFLAAKLAYKLIGYVQAQA